MWRLPPSETVTSTTYTTLAEGPSVTVSVLSNAKAMITITADITAPPGAKCIMSFGSGYNGATPAAPSNDLNSLSFSSPAGSTLDQQISATYAVNLFQTGTVTFQAFYRSPGGGSCTFGNRSMIVIPY